MNARLEIKRLLPAWDRFQAATDIGPIRSRTHYRKMVKLLEALLAEAGEHQASPTMALAEIVGELIEHYEAAHAKMPRASGADALRFLMQQHGLRQSDMPEIGSQGVVSEILAGKRSLNLRQVRALCQRFGVSPETFV